MALEERIEFAINPLPRCPVVLLLDNSASMKGAPISELNKGIQLFQKSVLADDEAALKVEVAIISFGNQPKLVQDFVTINKFFPPKLEANGNTPMGAAIELALDKLEARKSTYKNNGVPYYQPWVILISDGIPTDNYDNAAQRVRLITATRKLSFYCVAVRNADINVLKSIAPEDAPPLRLDGLKFSELFKWLSASVTATSRHNIGEQVELPGIGWQIRRS